ncbi:MAG: hypothetical protein HY762_04200 [Planctomycetes bacterium]|nr:hypothetical protein [Planctomycetota bacterium]
MKGNRDVTGSGCVTSSNPARICLEKFMKNKFWKRVIRAVVEIVLNVIRDKAKR